MTGSPWKSQTEGQEDQGEVKELGGIPPSCLKFPSGSSLGSLSICQTALSYSLLYHRKKLVRLGSHPGWFGSCGSVATCMTTSVRVVRLGSHRVQVLEATAEAWGPDKAL